VYSNQIDINMERFAWAELDDIHLANGAAYVNDREAQRIYHRVYPIIVRSLLSTVPYGKLAHLQRTGTAQGEEDQFIRAQFDEDVLRRCEKNPSTSTRPVVHAVGVGRCLVENVVREQELHPLHRQNVQALLGPNDYLRRDQFVRGFVDQYTEKRDFSAVLFFTDDACCTREGIFNSHNSHV
jgi:hypothetical protein